MDKKNTFLGIIFIAAGIGFMFWQSKQLEEQRREQLREEQTLRDTSEFTSPTDAEMHPSDKAVEAPEEDSGVMLGKLIEEEDLPVVSNQIAEPLAEEQIVTLANDFIEAEFTTRGGAIHQVHFLKTKRGEPDDYIFNEDGFLSALSLSRLAADGVLREFSRNYSIERQSADSITFVLNTADGQTIRRSYSIASSDDDQEPYVIKHTTTFANNGSLPWQIPTIYLNLGTARPISKSSQQNYLNVGLYDGEDADFIAINKLTGSGGFLGIGASSPKEEIFKESRIEWSSVKNQFFAGVLSSEEIAGEVFIYPVEAALDGDGIPDRPGISGSVGYSLGTVAAGTSSKLDFEYYVGPKEFKRLQGLGNEQDLVMQFGFLGFFSKLLLAFMYAIHSV
ncbi:MAG: membrane protein insertase YidC, partial [Opitutales bacterium]